MGPRAQEYIRKIDHLRGKIAHRNCGGVTTLVPNGREARYFMWENIPEDLSAAAATDRAIKESLSPEAPWTIG